MKVYFHDETAVECAADPEMLYCVWKACQLHSDRRRPLMQARVLVTLAHPYRELYLDITSIDGARTFSEIIMDAYSDTIPPSPPSGEMAVVK